MALTPAPGVVTLGCASVTAPPAESTDTESSVNSFPNASCTVSVESTTGGGGGLASEPSAFSALKLSRYANTSSWIGFRKGLGIGIGIGIRIEIELASGLTCMLYVVVVFFLCMLA